VHRASAAVLVYDLADGNRGRDKGEESYDSSPRRHKDGSGKGRESEGADLRSLC